MSKYNLTDIFEQYQMGSGWTNDFDYEGMLNAGLKIETDTPIEVMKAISDDFEDVNYHRENNYLQGAIDALEAGDVFDANGKLNDFRHEIKKTMATLEMDMSDDLGAYMASKMDLDEGNKNKENKDKMNEVRIDRDVAGRIEGMLNIPMKAKFLNAFEDLLYDLLDDEPFYVDDVIAHLSNEMHKRVDGNQMAGDRLAGIDDFKQEEFTAIDEGDDCSKHDYKQIDTDGTAECTKCGLRNSDPSKTGEKVRSEGYVETKGAALYPILKAGANATGDEVEMYVKSLAKDIELNGKEQYKDFKSDDFVEDFKNYIADKSLEEHFKRFI